MNPTLLKLLPYLIPLAEQLIKELAEWIEKQTEGPVPKEPVVEEKKEKVKKKVKEKIENLDPVEEKSVSIPSVDELKAVLNEHKNATSYKETVELLREYAPRPEQVPDEKRAELIGRLRDAL